MVLKLYGAAYSVATQTVLVTLKELKIPYELVSIDVLKGEQKDAQYVATKHPFGQIPVFVDEDGFQMIESRPIARYIVGEYAPESDLVPSVEEGLKVEARFNEAISIEYGQFNPSASGLVTERVLKQLFGGKRDEARAQEMQSKLEAKLKGYEAILAKQKYLAGDKLTIADLFHLPLGTIITKACGFTTLTSGELPNVARWWKDISERESWKEVVAEGEAAMNQ